MAENSKFAEIKPEEAVTLIKSSVSLLVDVRYVCKVLSCIINTHFYIQRSNILLVCPAAPLNFYRSPEEFEKGHCEGAVNIPLKIISGDEMVDNPNFDEQVIL
jgi:hypothetical protein